MIELMVRNHANETWSEANARDHEADPKESCQTCLGVFVRLGIPGGPNACVRETKRLESRVAADGDLEARKLRCKAMSVKNDLF